MKKISFGFVCLVLPVLLLCSCCSAPTTDHKEDSGLAFQIGSFYTDPDSFAAVHYVERAPTPLTKEELEACAESASGKLRFACQNADRIEAIPIVGLYLEETDLVAYLFYKNNECFRLLTLEIEETPRGAKIEELFLDPPKECSATSFDALCLGAVSTCREIAPAFEILAISFTGTPYPGFVPIGRVDGKAGIKCCNGGILMDFPLVDPFDSLEAGRELLRSYYAKQNAK